MIKHYKVLKNLARIHSFNYVSLESIGIDSDKNQYKEFEKNMVKWIPERHSSLRCFDNQSYTRRYVA